MRSLKTHIVLVLWLLALPLPAQADRFDLLREFAACAGRYGAQLDREWLMDAPNSNDVGTRRSEFAALVDALLPDARDGGLPTHQPLAWRIDARMAHAALLQRADFATDPDARAPARQLAQRYISACDQLLLAG